MIRSWISRAGDAISAGVQAVQNAATNHNNNNSNNENRNSSSAHLGQLSTSARFATLCVDFQAQERAQQELQQECENLYR